jgi:hypothetical protein
MDDEMVKCLNASCGWVGERGQCVHFHSDPYQQDFCPMCEAPVERVSDSAGDQS